VPAFVTTRHASDALREGGRHGGGRRLHRVLSALVVAEVALALVLLAGAGLLMRSFLKLQGTDPGFRAEGVLTIGVPLPGTRYSDVTAQDFYRDALARVSAMPGVQRAAGANCKPMPYACIGTSYWRTDRPQPAPGQSASSQVRPVTPEFFKTLGIPQLAGRDFNASDTTTSLPVAIVSEAVVREQFGNENPIGRRLRVAVNHASGRDDVEWTIVGVVANTKSTLDGVARQTIYIPSTQRPWRNLYFFVRTTNDPASLASSITGLLRSMEPEAPLEVTTLETIVGDTIARPRAISVLVGVFAFVALGLAAVGVYGVMAYSVRERTQEIGVRMALGASAASVFRLVIGQALRLVAMGLVAGLIAASLLTQLLKGLLFQVEPLDPWTFALTAIVLLTVATIASFVPARRGMRMAPLDALRSN